MNSCTLAMWAFIYIGLVVLIWWGIVKLSREEKPGQSPSCYGDFPHRNPQTKAERGCRECIYVTQCAERTPE